MKVKVTQSCSTFSDPYSPWNSPGQNTGVSNLSLLQWIFLTQELNQDLLLYRWILYQLSYQGNPEFSESKSLMPRYTVEVPRSPFQSLVIFLLQLLQISFCPSEWSLRFASFLASMTHEEPRNHGQAWIQVNTSLLMWLLLRQSQGEGERQRVTQTCLD